MAEFHPKQCLYGISTLEKLLKPSWSLNSDPSLCIIIYGKNLDFCQKRKKENFTKDPGSISVSKWYEHSTGRGGGELNFFSMSTPAISI